MSTLPIALLAALLAMTATAGARAEDLPVLSSHVCQTPSRDDFADRLPRDGSTSPAAQTAEDKWAAATRAVIGRCQQGDILVLAARNAAVSIPRYCDLDRPVLQLSPAGETICTFAGGRREPR
jgi:hypothetical protein